MRGMKSKFTLIVLMAIYAVQGHAYYISCFPTSYGQNTSSTYQTYSQPSTLYSYGYDYSPSLGDMDQTLLYGLLGGGLGYGASRLLGANTNNTILLSLLGAGIGAYAGYQEDTSENVERALASNNTRVISSSSSRRVVSSGRYTEDFESNYEIEDDGVSSSEAVMI